MKYKTYEDLSNCIRKNVWKVPADIDLIVGVPRSGMIPALMLAELLNKRCVDLDSFVEGREMSCGGRGRLIRNSGTCKVLVLDDTVFFGNALRKVRERLRQQEKQYEIIYGCIYAEGVNAKDCVDIYLEENYVEGEIYFYEWNILHHYGKRTKVSMWDIDGLICKEPPNDHDEKAYEAYLPNAVPMIVPTTCIGAIVTYRLEKYRTVTEEWLRRQNIEYGQLIMFGADSREKRKETDSPASYKAKIYRDNAWAQLFYESSARQAERIHAISGKPVFCYENGNLYI